MKNKPVRYAENTSVPVSRSRDEIEKELARFGAQGFAFSWHDGKVTIGFAYNDRAYKYVIQSGDDEQENRRRMRALVLCVKGKLVAVADGLKTFEEEFFGSMVMANGQTVDQIMLPEVQKAIDAGKLPSPRLLLGM